MRHIAHNERGICGAQKGWNTMRGADVTQERLFSYVTPEAFVLQAPPGDRSARS